MSSDWTPDEELLREALRAEASQVVPDATALSRIQERVARVPWWRRPITIGLAVAAATAVTTVAVATLDFGGQDPDRTGDNFAGPPTETVSPTNDATTEPDPEDSPAVVNGPSEGPETELPTEVPGPDFGELGAVAAYYISDTPMGPRLAREFREVRLGESLPETALATMVSGPRDPDYSSPWDPASEFSVVESPGVFEVDVADVVDAETSADAELVIQQIVYTVQAAVGRSTDTVRFVVDGEPVDEFLGVDVSDGVTREPQLDVRQLVQINNPNEGQSMTSPVVIDGEASLFEAHYDWQIVQDGAVVAESFGQSEECCRFAPFEFEVELEPGDYEVIVTASDPSGGEEGPGPMSDSRAFTVR